MNIILEFIKNININNYISKDSIKFIYHLSIGTEFTFFIGIKKSN